jgi:hypothetical protein
MAIQTSAVGLSDRLGTSPNQQICAIIDPANHGSFAVQNGGSARVLL